VLFPVLLATEPILIAVTIYQAFIYGMLYLFYVAYPIVFEEIRHWNLGISSLPFLGIVAGVLCGCAVVIAHILITAKPPKMDKDGKPIIIPEERLPIMIIGSILVPVGLFIFAWTSNPDIHWIGMAIGGFPIGMGMYMIFVQCFNYIIDVYMTIANSAIAGNTMVRSGFAAAFPLFGPAMFHRLGVEWATSLLAFLSLAMILIPVLFWKYGAQIRARSKNRIST
jgi:DHA1 family multidrug resistance protein-like MFS transporter